MTQVLFPVRKIFFVILISFWIWACLRVEAAEGFRLQTFKTHSRMVLGVDDGVPVEWKNGKEQFEIILKGLNLGDLGAPLGEEKAWIQQQQQNFQKTKDPRVAFIQFQEVPSGVKISGRWKFPQGKLALANPVMEYFDYRDKENPQYVIDFWLKKGPTLAEAQVQRLLEKRKSVSLKAVTHARQQVDRRLASEKLKSEMDEVTQFCREPLDDKTDIFLQFHPARTPVDFKRWFSSRAPDEHYAYFVPTGKSKDAQYIRLIHNLYRQGNWALALRTMDFLNQEFPDHNSRNDMLLLKASVYVKLGMLSEAEVILRQLMIEAKDSPVALQSGMFVASMQVERATPLAALESFMWLIAHAPNHSMGWVFHLGVAESLAKMKETERAAKEYQWVVENAPTDAAKAEGSMRIGDLYLERFQYEQALAAYYQALRYFKNDSQYFPSVYVNRGEALYQLGQMDRAQEAFEQYLKVFSAHAAGWRATFRLGEIYGRKSATAVASSRQWFYETVNRYPTSPGATLARIRLIPCGDQGGFHYESMQRFMQEAEKFDGGVEVSMKRYREFRAVAQVRALISMGKDDEAVAIALQELGAGGSPDLKPLLTQMVSRLFRKNVQKLLNEGREYDALAFYQEKKDLIHRSLGSSDFGFLLRLSQAASSLGLGSLAKKMSDDYEKFIGKTDSANRQVATQRSPHLSQESGDIPLETALQHSERSFTHAKALWVSNGVKAEAEIRKFLTEVREESCFSYEKEMILALLEEHQKNNKQALIHLAKALQLKPANQALPDVLGWRAALELQVGDPLIALGLYRDLEKHLKLHSEVVTSVVYRIPPTPTLEKVILTQAEIFESMQRWGEAAQTYARAREAGLGGNRAWYGYAQALLKSGNFSKGREQLVTLAQSQTDDFWKKLASETLANEKDQYLNRKISSQDDVQSISKEGMK